MLSTDYTTYNKAARYPVGHGYEKRVRAVSSLVVHSTSNPNQKNTAFSAEAKFLFESPLVSAHFLIGKDGAVVEFLDPALYMAWHAGNCQRAWDNAVSIGVELHHSVGDPPYPRQQLDALKELVRSLMIQYRIPAERVETHGQVAIKGPYKRKTDPADMSHAAFVALRTSLTVSLPNPPDITPASTLIAPPRATPAQCVSFILARPHGEYTSGDVQTIVDSYYRQAAGIDPLLAIAQMCHETSFLSSWWAARPRRNPAGIGVTSEIASREMHDAYPERYPDYIPGADGRWVRGLTFASWAGQSIPAHIGRLLAYAKRDIFTEDQERLVTYALSLRPLPLAYLGSAPTLQGLEGRWAVPGGGYAAAIARVANQIRAVKG